MNELLTTDNFFNTTAEDEQNYFFGTSSANNSQFLNNDGSLPAGNYRIVDGQLCHIISGLPTGEVRKGLLMGYRP